MDSSEVLLDMELQCSSCDQNFMFTPIQQENFREQGKRQSSLSKEISFKIGFAPPKRCLSCRAKRREYRSSRNRGSAPHYKWEDTECLQEYGLRPTSSKFAAPLYETLPNPQSTDTLSFSGSTNGSTSSSSESPKLCFSWQNKGACRFGDRCHFAHPQSFSRMNMSPELVKYSHTETENVNPNKSSSDALESLPSSKVERTATMSSPAATALSIAAIRDKLSVSLDVSSLPLRLSPDRFDQCSSSAEIRIPKPRRDTMRGIQQIDSEGTYSCDLTNQGTEWKPSSSYAKRKQRRVSSYMKQKIPVEAEAVAIAPALVPPISPAVLAIPSPETFVPLGVSCSYAYAYPGIIEPNGYVNSDRSMVYLPSYMEAWPLCATPVQGISVDSGYYYRQYSSPSFPYTCWNSSYPYFIQASNFVEGSYRNAPDNVSKMTFSTRNRNIATADLKRSNVDNRPNSKSGTTENEGNSAKSLSQTPVQNIDDTSEKTISENPVISESTSVGQIQEHDHFSVKKSHDN
jgi:hypothetical protein